MTYRFDGNNAKGGISKRVFQENKAHQIFRKMDIYRRLNPLTPDVQQKAIHNQSCRFVLSKCERLVAPGVKGLKNTTCLHLIKNNYFLTS